MEALRRERVRYAWRKTEEQSEEEKAAEASPFPALLRPPRKETRTVLDLVEAIRQVKVISLPQNFSLFVWIVRE